MNATNLWGSVIFGSIGVAAFIYGKRTAKARSMFIGAALVVFPYFVNNALALCLIGTLLTVGLFFP